MHFGKPLARSGIGLFLKNLSIKKLELSKVQQVPPDKMAQFSRTRLLCDVMW